MNGVSKDRFEEGVVGSHEGKKKAESEGRSVEGTLYHFCDDLESISVWWVLGRGPTRAAETVPGLAWGMVHLYGLPGYLMAARQGNS